MESFKQKRANLLNENPIASHGSWISKHSIAAGSPVHMGGSGKSPLYIDPTLEKTLKPGKEENLGTTTTSERVKGGTKKTFTTRFKTPGDEVTRTSAGDKAYASLTPEGRKKQDSAYLAEKNRQEVKTRFIPDALETSLNTTGISSPKISADTSGIRDEIFNREFDKKESDANFGLRQSLYEDRYSGVDRGSMSNTEKLAQNKYSKLRKTAEQRKSASSAQKKQIAKSKLKKALTINLPKGAKKGSMNGKAGCPGGC
jgi:hypothetical protein